ncbi:MAG: type IV pilus assembly protein PilM [Gaiellaceae bacterium]
MSDSIWKKDLSFRKKKIDDLPETAESLRVKELAFQRKLAEAAQAAALPVVEAPKAAAAPPEAPAPKQEKKKQSIWKKEIGGGSKKADAKPAAPEPPATLPPAPVAEMPAPAVAIAPAPVEVAPPAPVLDVPVEGLLASSPFAAGESIWKKEISFRRKAAEPQEPSVAPASGDELPAPPVSIWKKEISFRRKGDQAEEQPKSDSIWHKDISLRRSQARSAQIRALADEALRQVDAAAQPEPWLAGPELPPEPAPEPVAAAPAKAAEPPAPKTPIWKRELGKPKASKQKEPKADETPKKEKAPKAKRERKPKTRLRDVKISLPKPAAKSSGGHAVKRLVGLKIGASQLAAARVSNNGAAELVQVARQPLEQGVVVGGEVRDPEALALALKQFFAKNKLPRKNVRLGIASNRIGVRVFDLVGIDDEKQLENAIRFRAQEALPIPLDEAVLDYHILGESLDEDGTAMQRVLLVVAYRELVERYVSACKKAGITLAGVDLEAFALLRALGAPRAEETEADSALVAVAIGHDRSTFAVSDGRICEFTRVIEWGGSTLSVAIARALDLAPSEVEQLKRLVSLESPAVPEGIAADQYAGAVEAVRRQVQAFARELVSSLQFYQHQPGSLGIGEIVITGGTAGLAGLAAELQSLIGVHVRVGDPLARMKVQKKLALDEDLGSYAIAIGLGIED